MKKATKKLTKKSSKKLHEEAVQSLKAQIESKKTAPLLEIRQKGDASKIMVGANTELLIDGQPVRGATGVTFEVNAKGVAKATITLVGRFQITGRPLTQKVKLYK